jgi:hypothetical protein
MKNHISLRVKIGKFLFTLSVITFGIILGGNYYQLIAEIPNWSNDIPNSLVSYRGFYKVSHAGYFFQTIVPITILLLLTATILLWNRPKSANKWLFLAFGGILISEVFTVIYFLPRNFTLFLDPLNGKSAQQLQQMGTEWQYANYFRLLIVTLTMLAFLKTEEVLILNLKKSPKLKEEELALS